MKRVILSFAFSILLVFGANAQKEKSIPHSVRMMKSSTQRTEIILPQVKGYNIYKGDFHIHTSYSDGVINPAGRVVEAWLDGLDIIAITDHYEGHSGVKKFLKVTAPYNEDGQPTPYQTTAKVGSVKIDFNAIHNEGRDVNYCQVIQQADFHHFSFLPSANALPTRLPSST